MGYIISLPNQPRSLTTTFAPPLASSRAGYDGHPIIKTDAFALVSTVHFLSRHFISSLKVTRKKYSIKYQSALQFFGSTKDGAFLLGKDYPTVCSICKEHLVIEVIVS